VLLHRRVLNDIKKRAMSLLGFVDFQDLFLFFIQIFLTFTSLVVLFLSLPRAVPRSGKCWQEFREKQKGPTTMLCLYFACQFHQHFTKGFYSRRYQKHKMTQLTRLSYLRFWDLHLKKLLIES